MSGQDFATAEQTDGRIVRQTEEQTGGHTVRRATCAIILYDQMSLWHKNEIYLQLQCTLLALSSPETVCVQFYHV